MGKLDGEDAEDEQPSETTGRFELYGPSPASVVTMGTLEDGGFVATSHQSRAKHVMLNHNQLGAGLFVVDAKGSARPMNVVQPEKGEEQPEADNNQPPPETNE